VNWRELRVEPNFMVKELRESNGASPAELGGLPMKAALSGAGVSRAAKFAFVAARRFDLDSLRDDRAQPSAAHTRITFIFWPNPRGGMSSRIREGLVSLQYDPGPITFCKRLDVT
jgi:hypothetical protein